MGREQSPRNSRYSERGATHGAEEIQTTTAEAEAAAMKAVNFLSKARLIEPNKAFLKYPELCDGCGACVPSCSRNTLALHGLMEEQLYAQIRGILSKSEAEWKIPVFMEENISLHGGGPGRSCPPFLPE